MGQLKVGGVGGVLDVLADLIQSWLRLLSKLRIWNTVGYHICSYLVVGVMVTTELT